MDLKQLIKILKKHMRVSLLLSLVLAVITFFASYYLPVKYKAVGGLYVFRRDDPSQKDFFTYEGYYAIQTAERYTDTVVGLLKSVEIRREALETAGVAFNSSSLSKLDRSLIVKRVGPQVISVTLTSVDRAYADKVWLSLTRTVMRRAETLNTEGDFLLSISFISDPNHVVVESNPNPILNSFVAFLLGVFISVFFFSFKSYMKG